MEENLFDLIQRAEELPQCMQKVQMLEDAIRIADTQQELDLAFQLRASMVKAASWIGRVPEALAAFTWQLGQADADPSRFPEQELFFQYQWIISDCVGVPTIPRGEIEQMLDDLESRLQRNGISLRSASHLRWRMAMRMGHFQEALEEQKRWRSLERDSFCFDVSCECDSEVELLIELRRDREALICAEPILSGKYRWHQAVPEFTLGNLLISCVRLGRMDQALKFHKWGYPLIRSDHSQLYQHTRHMLYLVWTNDLTKAFGIFKRQLARFSESSSPNDHAKFLWASGLLLRKLAPTQPAVELQTSQSFSFGDAEPMSPGVYSTVTLADSFMEESMRLCRAFDRRDGNDHGEQAFREEEQLCKPTASS